MEDAGCTTEFRDWRHIVIDEDEEALVVPIRGIVGREGDAVGETKKLPLLECSAAVIAPVFDSLEAVVGGEVGPTSPQSPCESDGDKVAAERLP